MAKAKAGSFEQLRELLDNAETQQSELLSSQDALSAAANALSGAQAEQTDQVEVATATLNEVQQSTQEIVDAAIAAVQAAQAAVNSETGDVVAGLSAIVTRCNELLAQLNAG